MNQHINMTRWSAVLATITLVAAASADLPEWGMHVSELSAFDDAVQNVLTDNGLTAAAVGVMKEGCVVYQRGFGYRDESAAPLPEHATMRLASVSKALTARAIIQLVESGAITSYDRYAFDLGQTGGGILDIEPFSGVAGDGVDEITVRHLLDHKSGWAADYSWWEIAIAEAIAEAEETEVDSPPGLELTISWVLSRDLAANPGDEYVYSNFGYNVLSMIVEEVSGMSFINYLRQHVMTTGMWVPNSEIFGGLPFFEQRGPREPVYIAEGSWTSVPNVFDPDGPDVPWPYGGFDTEATYGSSSVVTSVVPLLAFLHAYYPDTGPVWLGSEPGVNSAIKARPDDIGIVVLINERIGDGAPYHAAQEIADRISDIIDSGVTWPDQCIDGFWVRCWAFLTGNGSYDRPFANLQIALDNTGSGSRLQFQPGVFDWTGTVDRRVAWHAPLGGVRIGDLSGGDLHCAD